jgi:hypothetical protein
MLGKLAGRRRRRRRIGGGGRGSSRVEWSGGAELRSPSL